MKKIEKMYADYEDIGLLIEMSEEEPDDETIEEIREDLERFQEEFEELRIGTLLTGEYDRNDAIMSIHAGAGGTESCDWASMLYRMYTRWAEKKGFTVEVLDYLEGDVAGIKGVTFEVRGENAYGYLRSEKGVHRLVRISPFNAAGKRQTSFVSCDVIPDIEDEIEDRDQRRRSADRYVPIQRSRRTAYQQDVFGSAYYASSDRNRCTVSE